MPTGLQEGDIKAGIAAGGRILNVFIVRRDTNDGPRHVAYLRPNWGRGFRVLRTWADKADRTYRDLARLVTLVRNDFAYQGYIVLYEAGDPELARYKSMLAADQPMHRLPGTTEPG